MPPARPLVAAPSKGAPPGEAQSASEDAPETPDGWPSDLASLRAELDRIDDSIHDLLMRRAEVVAQVANSASKTTSRVPLRPGREAAIIRRLLARHTGALPPLTLVRLWRELLAGTTAIQREFRVAVFDTEAGGEMIAAAREQFGALTPLQAYHTPGQALAALAAGAVSVAVLPLPDEAQAWWTALLETQEPRLHVVARLPFWAPRPEGAPLAEALVVAPIAPDASGQDRTLIGLALHGETPRARIASTLREAGFEPHVIVAAEAKPEDGADVLIEIDGFVAETASPISELTQALGAKAIVLGAYAVPITGEAG